MNHNDDYIKESVRGKIGQLTRTKDDGNTIKGDWKGSRIKTIKLTNIDDKKFSIIESAHEGMRKAESWNQYNKHFKTFADTIGMPSEQTVIAKVQLTSKKDTNTVKVRYAVSEKKVTLPKGTILIHKAPDPNLRHLKPFFKGKATKGYLYSNPRVYFTTKKDIIKIATDNKRETKLWTYTPDETITSAWIDPLLPTYSWSCVYIDTTYPIKCHRVDQNENMKESTYIEEDALTDEPTFNTLEEFMEFYGLEFAEDDDIFNESTKEAIHNVSSSIKETLGTISRKIGGKKDFKKKWQSNSNLIKHKVREVNHDEMKKGDLDELKKHYKTVSDTSNYHKYLGSFKWICKFFGISNNATIDHLWFKDDSVVLDYNDSDPKKIILPADSELVHISPNENIKELEPTFKSKTKGKYMYPKKRVFFTIGKKTASKRNTGLEGQKTFKYHPKENIKTAFIDPSYPEFKKGYVYVDTSFPIPVERVDKSKAIKESVDETMLLLYESEMNGDISKDELNYLLDSLQ